MQLAGVLVTIDAMGCQTAIAEAVIAKSADYLLTLKGNQLSLSGEVELFFADPERRREPCETVEADHDRIENRTHFVSHDVDWLSSGRHFPGEPRFPGRKAIAMVEAIIEVKATSAVTTARRYFICSMALDALFFAKAAHTYWDIENRLHWVLVFHDDVMRL